MFQPITIKWDKAEYKIPGNAVMELIDRVEAIVTLDELHRMQVTGSVRRMQLSKAYATAINYGIEVSDSADKAITPDEVYRALYDERKAMATMTGTIYGLLVMLLPPGNLKMPEPDESGKKKRKRA